MVWTVPFRVCGVLVVRTHTKTIQLCERHQWFANDVIWFDKSFLRLSRFSNPHDFENSSLGKEKSR